MSDSDQLIRETADQIAITALIHRYAFYVRRGEGLACGPLFTTDAFYDIRQVAASAADNPSIRRNRIEGREAIGAYIDNSGRQGVRVCPLIHNILIELHGDDASATSMLESRTWPAGRDFIGEYEDRFVRTKTGWLFASRTFTLFQSAPPPDETSA